MKTAAEEFDRARTALAETSQQVIDSTRKSAALADKYVHGHAWAVAGIAIAAGMLIGFLAAKR